MTASHFGVRGSSASPLPLQLPADAPTKWQLTAAQACTPAIHPRDPQGVSGFCLQPGPALAVAAMWGVNQLGKICLCPSTFEIKT